MVRYHQDAYSFHLSASNDGIYSDSSTVSSNYKQRIDSLFRPNKKRPENAVNVVVQPPAASGNKVQEEIENMFGGRDQRQRAFNDIKTTVQAQIEKLFSDASGDGPRGLSNGHVRIISLPRVPEPPPLPAPFLASADRDSERQKPTLIEPQMSRLSTRRSQSHSSLIEIRETVTPPKPALPATKKFRVDYLGAVQLNEKATSLDVLQEPLKESYYHYRLNISRGQKPFPGSLQITEAGLKITNGIVDSPGGHFEFTNPFPTIAVWAAVKLVIRKEISARGILSHKYAFMPLICDPEAQEKHDMYNLLNVPDPSVFNSLHPPMFACVMRKVGVPKVLECHGFICHSAEDAIVIAANLYQALLENMRNDTPSETSENRDDDDHGVMSDCDFMPARPPRRKRTSTESTRRAGLRRANSEDLLQSQIYIDNNRASQMNRLKRSASDRNPGAFLGDIGDVYTKVALPRSKSFINVTNKYDFQDLMDDVREKTGLNSVNDVLKQIIKPNGMSYSEMDPKHRDILLKLAVTLSRDEIYQRSKNIMRKQKRSTSLMSLIDSDSDASTISSVFKATKRSFSKLGSRASSLQTSYMERSPLKKLVSNRSRYSLDKVDRKSIYSGSEYSHMLESGGRKVAPKTPMPKRNHFRMTEEYISCSECGYESECSSKCYCTIPTSRRPTASTNNNSKTTNKKSNHRPLCDCDTESCAESEKCYCSLKSVKTNGVKTYKINLDSETDTTETTLKSGHAYRKGYGSQSNLSQLQGQGSFWKSSDSSSISVLRNKSSSPYCHTEHSNSRSAGTVFSMHPDVLRRKSLSSNLSTDSEFSVVHRSSGGSGYHSQESNGCRQMPIKARSTESLLLTPRSKRHPSGSVGSRGSRESAGSGGSSHVSSRRGSGSQRSKGSRESTGSQQKILLVSAVDPSGKVVYRGASQRQQREMGGETSSILSMKKTAEIAALFSELKLNQTTDLVDKDSNTSDSESDDAYSSMQANNNSVFSENIEQSLGYLP